MIIITLIYRTSLQNINEKMRDEEFLTDVEPLLRPEISFEPQIAYQLVFEKLIDKMTVKP